MLLQHWTASLKKNTADSPYRKPRSHFLWYISVDAFLSVFLVVGIFQFVESRQHDGDHESELMHAGAIAMSSAQIVDHIRLEGRSAYWLGPQDGAKYATNDIVPHKLTITYLPRGSDLYTPDQPKMTVQTFDDLESFQRIEHVYLDSYVTKRLVTKNGNTVIYDPRNMKSEIVFRPDDPAIIVINYTHELSQDELLTKADSLKPVW